MSEGMTLEQALSDVGAEVHTIDGEVALDFIKDELTRLRELEKEHTMLQTAFHHQTQCYRGMLDLHENALQRLEGLALPDGYTVVAVGTLYDHEATVAVPRQNVAPGEQHTRWVDIHTGDTIAVLAPREEKEATDE